MKRLTSALLILISFWSLRAQALEGCTYERRPADPYFEKLPPEILGWADCAPKNSEMNIIYVARLGRRVTRERVQELLKRYIDIVAPKESSARLVKDDSSKSGIFFELETLRDLGSTTHFAYTVTAGGGESYLMLYSDTRERAFNVKGTLRVLQRLMAQDRFIIDLE